MNRTTTLKPAASWRLPAAAFALAAAAAASLLAAACGDSEPRLRDASRPDQPDLLVWHGFETQELPLLRELVGEFEARWEAKTGRAIRVQAQYTPFAQMETKLRTAAIAHQTPDVCFLDALKVLGLAYGKAIVPLDELESFPAGGLDELRDEFVPGAFDTNVVNVQGKTNLYGLPAQTTCVALFYNKALFRRFNDQLRARGLDPTRPPETWDELIGYAQAMTIREDGQFGWAINRSLWWSYPMLNSFRAELLRYDDDGRARPAFTDERAVGAMSLLSELASGDIEGGAWVQGGLTPDQGFLNGKYAMSLNGPWKVADFIAAGLDFGVAPIPRLSRERAERAGLVEPGASDEEYRAAAVSSSNLGGQNLVMFRTCPDKELALEFMLWFTSEEVQRRWCSELTQIPVRLAAREGLELQNAEYFNVFIEQVATTLAPPLVPLAGLLETDIFNKELELLFSGAKTPEQAAASISARLDKEILAKMNAY